MILIIWNGKRKSFDTVEKMRKKLKLDRIDQDDSDRLIKASQKGDALYGCVNGKVSQLDGERIAIIADTMEELENIFYQGLEEI